MLHLAGVHAPIPREKGSVYTNKDKLQDNSLFNQISGYAPTGGFVGSFFGFLSKQLDKLAGLSESSNDSYVNSLLVCKKFYQDKDQNKTQ